MTAIEDWLRDPYTIYAKYILKLAPLDPVDMPLSAADRGSAIHDALGEFTQAYATALPDDPARALRGIGEKYFAPLMERPEARALWWPRFQRIAGMVRRMGDRAARQCRRHRRRDPRRNSRFRSTMRAPSTCRRAPTGSNAAATAAYAILDYKTGQPPTGKQVRMGLSPQLTLEAAILREGGFAGIAAGASVSELAYVRLSGNNPPGEQKPVELKINQSDHAAAAR